MALVIILTITTLLYDIARNQSSYTVIVLRFLTKSISSLHRTFRNNVGLVFGLYLKSVQYTFNNIFIVLTTSREQRAEQRFERVP